MSKCAIELVIGAVSPRKQSIQNKQKNIQVADIVCNCPQPLRPSCGQLVQIGSTSKIAGGVWVEGEVEGVPTDNICKCFLVWMASLKLTAYMYIEGLPLGKGQSRQNHYKKIEQIKCVIS